ncbi:MAG: hypothetical protein BIFFINMI_02434 [Phycisphaerae bacterium]|nr:hypothetical protein [Phycisphaerae bacterium]
MVTVDTDIPAGNAVVESVAGDEVRFRPDLRDTSQTWFYWHLRVRGAGGRTLRFVMTQDNMLTCRGPAASLDGGWTWAWLGPGVVDGPTFRYDVPAGVDDVRLSMGMPYTDRNLAAFLARVGDSPYIQADTLCTSRKGRPVRRLLVGAPDGTAPHGVLLTARHHCCEMMANYAMEGLIETAIANNDLGRRLRDRIEFMIVPFVDTDGVEDGDQGKQRKPHDHGRDYEHRIYPETAAIREQAPRWAGGRPHAAIDLHCPWIRGKPWNETIYIVGQEPPPVWERQLHFGRVLESVRRGPLPYFADGNLPFGQAWNVAGNYAGGLSMSRWATGLDENRLVAGIEIPYADVHGVPVTADSARRFGKDLAAAIVAYLDSTA